MPTLTIRIENNSQEHKNLDKVKEIFGETSSTKAIFKALEYAAKKQEIHAQMLDLARQRDDNGAKVDAVRRKIREQNRIHEQLIDFSNQE